jgi:transposase
MEDILGVYERCYDPRWPVVCFDERPYQLLEGQELAMRPGRAVRREDSQYQRRGTCCVLMAVEPRAGRRVLEVQPKRGKREYARFLKRLATRVYPEAERIVLVQDNLNTHQMGCLYENFPAAEARRLAERFELHFTPKKASWLNMAEIEFSAMSKQCLGRRIGSIGQLRRELNSWERRRNRKRVKIRWRFTTDNARDKLDRHYQAVRN